MPRPACLLFLIWLLHGAPASAERPAELPDDQAFIDGIQHTIASGDSASTMDLLCRWIGSGRSSAYALTDIDRWMALWRDWTAFQHKRYLAVFTPPSPLSSYFPPECFGWDQYEFTGTAFGIYRGFDDRAEYCLGRLVIRRDAPAVTIDLDLDGVAEMRYDGVEPVFSPDVAVVRDDAGDGRRYQWLAGDRGTDPRTAARIWLYRDGAATSIIVKVDSLVSGRSWCWGGISP